MRSSAKHLLAILVLTSAICFGQKTKVTPKFNSAKVDTNYFLGSWNVYNYKIQGGEKKYFNYTDESNCCRRNKDCIPEADVVDIVREEANVLELYWPCEKGSNSIQLKLPDMFLTDTRIYTNDPHKWQAHKIKYLSQDEFIIENWRQDTCVNRFVRRKKE